MAQRLLLNTNLRACAWWCLLLFASSPILTLCPCVRYSGGSPASGTGDVRQPHSPAACNDCSEGAANTAIEHHVPQPSLVAHAHVFLRTAPGPAPGRRRTPGSQRLQRGPTAAGSTDALPPTARRLQGQQQVWGDGAAWRGSHGDLRTLRAWHATPAAATLAFHPAHRASGEAQQALLAVLPRTGALSTMEVPTVDATFPRSGFSTSLGMLSQGGSEAAIEGRTNRLLHTLAVSSEEHAPRPARRLMQLVGPRARSYVGPRVLDFNGLTW